nr:uncharacterized protein LOC109178743 [Ipomoea trifida]
MQWIARLLEGVDDNNVAKMMGLMYAIWMTSNNAVWNFYVPTTLNIWQALLVSWNAWVMHGNIRSSRSITEPIPQNYHEGLNWRCMVNVGLQPQYGTTAYGFIITSVQGAFLIAKNGPLWCAQDPLMAEAMAIQEALTWIKQHNLSHILVVSNCFIFCSSLLNVSSNRSYINTIAYDCRCLISSIIGCKIRYIARDRNHATHSLAKADGAWLSHSE